MVVGLVATLGVLGVWYLKSISKWVTCDMVDRGQNFSLGHISGTDLDRVLCRASS
jgi:hypothetical protein